VDTRQTTFHDLYNRYAPDVYRFAHWLTGNPEDAQDITSETFVRAWTAPEEPRMETVKAYLFTIARNLHRRQWRRQSRLELLDVSMPPQAAQPDETAVNLDEFRRTLEAVHSLPEIDKTVLLLRAEQEMSYEDIAAVTGLSIAAAKVKVFRFRSSGLTRVCGGSCAMRPRVRLFTLCWGVALWIVYAVERSRARSL